MWCPASGGRTAGPGLVLPLLARYTEKVRRGYLEQPFTDLVELIRTGPPTLSMFALPGVDELANLSEYFVHCEDVRRAAPAWEPRDLPLDLEEALWGALARMAKLALRRSKDPVRLVRPDGAEISGGPAGQPVRLRGEVSELVLYLFGRTSVAQVRSRATRPPSPASAPSAWACDHAHPDSRAGRAGRSDRRRRRWSARGGCPGSRGRSRKHHLGQPEVRRPEAW